MEFKTEPRKRAGYGFLKIVLFAIFLCLVIHFIFSWRHEVADEFNVWILPYLQYPPSEPPTLTKWMPKGPPPPPQEAKLSERPRKAVVVVATGGIGNQLFMYAAGYAFARCLGVPLFVSPALPGNFDFGIFPEPHPNTLVREFLLHHFNVPSHQLVKYDQMQQYLEGKDDSNKREKTENGRHLKVKINNIHELNFHNTVEAEYRRSDPRRRENTENTRTVYLLKHNFQSHLFFDGFESEVKEIFNLEGYINSRMALTNYYLHDLMKEVRGQDSVAVHVRRGDFLLANSEYTPLPWKYFEKAMKEIGDAHAQEGVGATKQDVEHALAQHPKPQFYVFSDSLDIVKEEFKERGLLKYGVVTFVSNGEGMTNLKELYLMQNCKDFIIPNSAFSWWAAFLNSGEDKTVIAPYPRFTKSDYAANPRKAKLDNMFPIYPPQWKLINPWEQ